MAELLPECRLIIEETPRSGAWNMGLDEALLESAMDSGRGTLRWYRWEHATASLGYFQGHAELALNPRLAGLPVVRRLSGGGTIVHEHEWTYCLVLPPAQRLVHQPHELYELVHGEIVAGLAAAGFAVRMRGETQQAVREPLLCFARQDARDVVSGDWKVLGSAQRRRKGALLQHGSLNLRAPSAAPQHPGLEDLHPQRDAVSTALIAGIAARICRKVAEQCVAESWLPGEWESAARLAAEQAQRVRER